MTVMYTFKIYKDVLREIDLIQDQLFYTKQELKKWFGVDIDTGKGIPLDGYLSHKFGANRSEEHTSELQSRFDLVGRLLLEKMKQDTTPKQGLLHRLCAVG